MDTSAQQPRSLGEKYFGAEDLKWFAQVSLDRNPIHTDPIAARRLLTGTQLAHGSHLVLTALELALAQNVVAAGVTSLRCNYPNPVNVGDCVCFVASAMTDGSVQIDASVRGLLCCQLILASTPLPQAAAQPGLPSQGSGWSRLTRPCDEAPEFHCGKSYPIALNEAEFEHCFAHAVSFFGRHTVAAIASFSYMVGMVCPGLHSMTSSLQLELQPDAPVPDTLIYRIDRYDARLRLFHLSFEGCVAGTLKAFYRPPPQRQPSMGELSQQVRPGEFAGSRSLVIGGSRGLGELTARLLASGGGEVVLSYAVGRDEAEALCTEINAATDGHCEALQIDLLRDDFDTLSLPWARLDTVYFFATPRIFRKKAGLFDAALLAEFTHFYVDKFYEMCMLLEAQSVFRKVHVFLPSTVDIEKRPKGMTEYLMAKAAAEMLAHDISRSARHVEVLTRRLPRLSTDQTATILKTPSESNVGTLLPILRGLHLQAAG